MQTIQSKITGLYGQDAWEAIQPDVQDIARGQVTIQQVQRATGLTEWKARSTIDAIKEFVYVPDSKVYDDPPAPMQTWLIIPDVHRPFHNRVLWDKVLQLIYDMGSDLYGLIFLGDYLDAYSIGSYNDGSLHNLGGCDLGQEYEEGSAGLDQVDEVTHDGARKIFMFGNHEDRFQRHVQKGDNARYGSALKDPTEGLRLRERGYTVFDNYGEDYYVLGDHLEVFHGDYTNKYAANKHLRMSGSSCLFGHSHCIQSFHKGDKAAFNIGWLGDKHNDVFSYSNRLNRKKWANGFALVYIDDNGDYYVNQITVWNDRFFINGKQY